MTISGTGEYDGTHEATFEGSWFLSRNPSLNAHQLRTPLIKLIRGNENPITIGYISVRLPKANPFGPRPFEFSDTLRIEAPLVWMRDLQNRMSVVDNAFAVAVPEPSTLTLGSFALLSLTAFCRRRHSYRSPHDQPV